MLWVTNLPSFIPQMCAKYLQPSERTDIIFVAMKALKTPGAYSISMAADMVTVLVLHTDFPPGQVSSLCLHR